MTRRTPRLSSRSRREDLLRCVAPRVVRVEPGEGGQGELRAGDEQVSCAGRGQASAGIVVADEQAAVLEQVQPIERGKAAALLVPAERGRRPPEHRQPLVQDRPLAPLHLRDRPDRVAVAGLQRIAEDQAEVDVADQRAETAVRKAAQRIAGQQPVTQRDSVGVRGFGQHPLAVHVTQRRSPATRLRPARRDRTRRRARRPGRGRAAPAS